MSAVEYAAANAPCHDELAIRVRADGECWTLDCGPGFETLVFESGAAAESAGRNLATRFARSGQEVRMIIEDRRHEVVGTKIFFPLARADQQHLAAPVGWAWRT